MIKQLLKAVMTMALFLSVILSYAETTEGKMFYGLPTYTVGNYMYAVHEFGKSYDILPKYKNSSIYKYTGAILIQGNRIKLWPRQGFHEGNLVKSLHGIDVS